MASVTFLIADKSLIIRKGLISIIEELKYIKSIKEVNDESELTKKIERTEPDFVIINKCFLNNEKKLFDLINKYQKIKFIQLSDSKKIPEIIDIKDDAISIFEEKNEILKKLKKLICISSNIQENNYQSSQLTKREKAILKYIALGFTNKELADKLFISPHTAITHRKNITKKLNIKTISGLTVYAILNNVINPTDLK